jgi:hypothetical protein
LRSQTVGPCGAINSVHSTPALPHTTRCPQHLLGTIVRRGSLLARRGSLLAGGALQRVRIQAAAAEDAQPPRPEWPWARRRRGADLPPLLPSIASTVSMESRCESNVSFASRAEMSLTSHRPGRERRTSFYRESDSSLQEPSTSTWEWLYNQRWWPFKNLLRALDKRAPASKLPSVLRLRAPQNIDRLVIHPYNWLKLVFDLLIILLVFYTAFTMPIK